MPKAAALDLLAALLAVWGYLGGGAVPADSPDQDFLMVTVATEETDGFRRFMYSANKYGLHVKVFGMGLKWDGGDVARYAGGGHKINILKDGLKDYVDRNLTVMYVDSYDVVFTNGSERILDFFRRFKAKVVFSAEGFCWPDESLVSKYPPVGPDEKRFLNSGGFIGNIKEVYEIVTYKKIMNQDDDQLYYTEIFLDEDLRERWNIKLDTKGMIFQNLNGALGEVMLKFKGNRSYLYNVKTKKLPVVIHGNGPIKPEFNRIANYLSDGWTSSTGCQSCKEDVIRLSELKEDDYPPVLVAIFIEHPAPFLREFFEKIAALTYPKKHIDIFLHNSIEYHKPHVEEFLKVVRSKYKSINVVSPEDMVNEVAARNWAIQESIQKSHKYLFSVDPVAHLDNPDTLQLLIEQNRSIVAPVLVRPQKLWSNFWGALSQEGFYTRSEDYLDIVSDKKIGLWNVPYISSVMLIQGHSLKTLYDAYSSNYLDPDMSFAKTCRDKGIFMFASNREKFGHLISNENFDTTFTSSELFEIMENPLDWEKRYIHENYSRSLHDDFEPLQPCPDVFWFPVTTEHFCKELIALMESYGKWSSGKSLDPRLAGGYENVPTVDIHMKQVGLEKHWLQFLWKYVTPLQRKAFAGYFNEPPNAIMNFVVRYKPDEQPSLRPHHDSSTYTINIALNHPQIDFEGGGCRFIRYNCSVRNTRKGWMLMHPGRLTHFHEGLQVTNGTRYIMISFVDP